MTTTARTATRTGGRSKPDGRQTRPPGPLHAHSTAPFTRSATITIPSDVGCVVVRGHDQTHEYGGQAMTVAVPIGATRAIQHGAERRVGIPSRTVPEWERASLSRLTEIRDVHTAPRRRCTYDEIIDGNAVAQSIRDDLVASIDRLADAGHARRWRPS